MSTGLAHGVFTRPLALSTQVHVFFDVPSFSIVRTTLLTPAAACAVPAKAIFARARFLAPLRFLASSASLAFRLGFVMTTVGTVPGESRTGTAAGVLAAPWRSTTMSWA